MRKRPFTVFIDLDQTLIHTPDYPFAVVGGVYSGRVLLRNFAQEFIDLMKNLSSEVYILTAGRTEYQKRVLALTPLRGMSRRVIGRDAVTPPSKRAVLIDNLPMAHPLVQEKARSIGAPVLFYRVSDFIGQDDDELFRAALAVKELVES